MFLFHLTSPITKADELRTKERLRYYLHSVLPAFPGIARQLLLISPILPTLWNDLRSMKAENFGERSVVTGDPEACIATLKKCEAAGIEEVILYFNFGNFNHRDTLKSMERFARDCHAAFLRKIVN